MSYICTLEAELKKLDDLIVAAKEAGATNISYGGVYYGEDVIASFRMPDGTGFGVTDRKGKMVLVADRDSKSEANEAVKDLSKTLQRSYAEHLLKRALADYGFEKDSSMSNEGQVVMTRKGGQEAGILQFNDDGTMSFGLRGIKGPECEPIAKFVGETLGTILSGKKTDEYDQSPGGVELPLPIKEEREASLKVSSELLKIANIKNPFEQELVFNNLYKDISFEYGSKVADKVAGKMLKKIAEVTLGDEIVKISSLFKDSLKFKS